LGVFGTVRPLPPWLNQHQRHDHKRQTLAPATAAENRVAIETWSRLRIEKCVLSSALRAINGAPGNPSRR